ncbi:MAG: hypothetical protein TEF_07780 [Rhizobiales bacterium NRL2]|jgi:hypothetical protein|nr:MAG: hypothetical protein TEF_07780 [Rhizobiales bacterium NRL2]
MVDNILESERPEGLSRQWVGAALIAIAIAVIAAALFVGLRGIAVSQQFSLTDAERQEGRLFLHRLEVGSWERPPLHVLDAARYGSSGTATEFYINGRRVADGRVSKGPLSEGARPGYLHTGVQNFYFTLGPEPPADPLLEARFLVRLDREVMIAMVAAAALLLAGGLLLLAPGSRAARRGVDVVLLALAVVAGATAWLALEGTRYRESIDPAAVRALAPVGYLYPIEQPWPLHVPWSDRGKGFVAGQLLEDGRPIGNPFAGTDEIRGQGGGAHFVGGGLLRFSTPDNSDPTANGRRYEVELTALLSPYVPAAFAAALLLLSLAAYAVGHGGIARRLAAPRPRTVAIVLPAAIMAVVVGYLGWLARIDPLHMFAPPAARDYFVPDEQYRMAGLVRTWPYEAIIVGTSISQNFYIDEAGEVLGLPTLNATIAGSYPAEQSELLRAALRDHGAERVLWEYELARFNLEPGRLRDGTFPFHLYDGNPLTDLEYAFTLQAWLDANAARNARRTGDVQALDGINKWGERREFGPHLVGEEYCARQDQSAGDIDAVDFRRNIRLSVRPLVEDFPGTAFDFFIPAYSALMHANPGGRLADTEFAARILHEELAGLSNYRLFDFQGIVRFAGDPELYRDASHYHPKVNRYILEAIAAGRHAVPPEALDIHEADLRERLKRSIDAFRAVMDPYCDRQATR